MLEDFFAVPAAAHRLRSSVLGAHLDGFASWLVAIGYPVSTVRSKLWFVAGLSRWMMGHRLRVLDVGEQSVDEYLEDRRRRGRRKNVFRSTGLQLLEHLRSTGVIPFPKSTAASSALTTLVSRYADYLRRERALAECTISNYVAFAGAFLTDRADPRATGLERLRPADVRDFLLARVRRMAPKRGQLMGTALRSFLRYLFVQGVIPNDLSFAVPTVRQWRLVDVPRHISASEVEKVLGACDLSSATGRRDRAILLLLARLGLRASEVLALELDDLRWREGEIVIRRGKGLIRDRLPLLPDVGEALALYLQRDRPACDTRRVFLRSRAPLRALGSPASVSTIVASSLRRAGLAPPVRGAHLLRHSLAVAMLRRGASLTEIGQVLRHRSPNTTEIYAKLDFTALRDVALPWPTAGGAR